MEATLKNSTKGNSMTYKLPTPTRIIMCEGEAKLRTVTDVMWEAKKVLHPKTYTILDNKIESIAERWWRATDDYTRELALHEIDCWISDWDQIPDASPIGHIVGYDQY
tara:strand:+ start:675 stop:998 length:324 start_codon:yes stop_codon:yes gene_type:complete